MMPYAIGIALALFTGLLARLVRFDRDRAVYPTYVIVVAHYYVLFAAITGLERTIIVESIIMAGFTVIAILGFRSSLWLVVAALAGHGALDLVHDRLVSNPGVPTWWPSFCLAYDVFLACILARLLRRGAIPARDAELGF
jgi:hypothetical protein